MINVCEFLISYEHGFCRNTQWVGKTFSSCLCSDVVHIGVQILCAESVDFCLIWDWDSLLNLARGMSNGTEPLIVNSQVIREVWISGEVKC